MRGDRVVKIREMGVVKNIPKVNLVLCQQTYLKTCSRFRSVSFCIVYTYIYSYIEQSSSGLLELFFSVISNCKNMTVSLLAHLGVPWRPETHNIYLLEQRWAKWFWPRVFGG